jgi:hypothetical protein
MIKIRPTRCTSHVKVLPCTITSFQPWKGQASFGKKGRKHGPFPIDYPLGQPLARGRLHLPKPTQPKKGTNQLVLAFPFFVLEKVAILVAPVKNGLEGVSLGVHYIASEFWSPKIDSKHDKLSTTGLEVTSSKLWEHFDTQQ